MKPPSPRVWLTAIVLVGAWVRLRGLAYGLPAVYNPDEVAIMSRALAFAKGDLNPHNFLYPTFYFYVLFCWIGAFFAGSWMVGAAHSLKQFQDSFFLDPSGIYLAGRVLTMICGSATVVAVYALGSRVFSQSVGLIAALLLAVSPLHVMDSHYVKHDVPVTLAIVIAHLAILGLVDAPEPLRARRAIAAGIACGAAIATQYYAVFVLVPLVLTLVLARLATDRAGVARITATSLAAVAVTFFVLSPFAVLEASTTWRDVVANRQIVIDRATTQGGLFVSLRRYSELLVAEGFVLPAATLAVAGVGVTIAQMARRTTSAKATAVQVRPKPDFRSFMRRWEPGTTTVMLLAFPLTFLLFISNTVPATRYLNPILPFGVLLAAIATVSIPDLLPSSVRNHRVAIVTLLAMVAAAPAFGRSLRIGQFFREADTRTLAQRFIEDHVPSGATILIQPYSVPIRQSREGLVEALTARYGDAGRASTKFALQLQLIPYPAPSYRLLYLGENGLDMDKLYVTYRAVSGPDGLTMARRLGVEYVVLKRYNVADPATQPLIGLLEARPREAQRLATFSPYWTHLAPGGAARVEPFLHNTDAQVFEALERPGPGIEIWKLTGES
ncbi:MAG: glycosyltransferase family 39 protein [Acidobacteria bacterium]|nr:glycosyltransferase family 39 protein [Acidobacteriota bacterium]